MFKFNFHKFVSYNKFFPVFQYLYSTNARSISGYLSVATKKPLLSNLTSPSQFLEFLSSKMNSIGLDPEKTISLFLISNSTILSTLLDDFGKVFK